MTEQRYVSEPRPVVTRAAMQRAQQEREREAQRRAKQQQTPKQGGAR